MSAADVINIIVGVASFTALVGFLYLWRLTGARGFMFKALACAWAFLVRVLLSAGVEPFVTYVAQFMLPFWTLLAIGVWATVYKLYKVYTPRGLRPPEAE